MRALNLVLLSGIGVLLVLGTLSALEYYPGPGSSLSPRSSLGDTSPLANGPSSTSTAAPSSSGRSGHSAPPRVNVSVPSAGPTGGSQSPGWPFSGSYDSPGTVSIDGAIDAMRSLDGTVRIFPENNTVAFSGSQAVTILAFGMMADDAENLTGRSPPGYATDDVFVVGGLIDPTLVIPAGAAVQLVFVNLDDDMYHNFAVTSLAPPYDYMPMSGMMWSNSSSSWYGGGMMGRGVGSGAIVVAATPILPPANYGQGLAYYYDATAFTMEGNGSYWYICTYPGHAQSGMYGRILLG